MPKETELITSAFTRFLQVGSLVGKIGFNLIGEKALSFFMPKESHEKRVLTAWIKNADKIFETLGKLKGGVMKVGQMLSLQEGMLPPEVIQILRLLQKESPPVKIDSIENLLKKEIENYDEIFESIESKPFASASIGQVYKATLKNKKTVAVKVQYPNIDRIIRADLKNLKIFFKLLISVFIKIDFDPIWEEIKKMLLEELDYENELKQQNQFIKLFSKNKNIIIPKPIQEASSKHILTTEFIEGKDIDFVKNNIKDQHQRNLWAETFLDIFYFQVYDIRLLHSDPNAGNYAFLPDGKIILYDFGSTKKIPKNVSKQYLSIVKSIYLQKYKDIPQLLKEAGIHHKSSEPIKQELIDFYLNLFKALFQEDIYCFDNSKELIQQIIDFGKKHWSESVDIVFPADVIFLHRSIGGLFGNLNTLNACVNGKQLLEKYIK